MEKRRSKKKDISVDKKSIKSEKLLKNSKKEDEKLNIFHLNQIEFNEAEKNENKQNIFLSRKDYKELKADNNLINVNLIIQNNNFINQNIKKEKTIQPKRDSTLLELNKKNLTSKQYFFPESPNPKRRNSITNENIFKLTDLNKFQKKHQVYEELDIKKFEQSEKFIQNMMKNKKRYNQLETNPEQFLLEGMKNMLNEKVQNENEQNEKLKNLFEKLCQKFGINNTE